MPYYVEPKSKLNITFYTSRWIRHAYVWPGLAYTATIWSWMFRNAGVRLRHHISSFFFCVYDKRTAEQQKRLIAWMSHTVITRYLRDGHRIRLCFIVTSINSIYNKQIWSFLDAFNLCEARASSTFFGHSAQACGLIYIWEYECECVWPGRWESFIHHNVKHTHTEFG